MMSVPSLVVAWDLDPIHRLFFLEHLVDPSTCLRHYMKFLHDHLTLEDRIVDPLDLLHA